jgi:integrase
MHMPRRGTPTEIPGLSRDGTKWILRARYVAKSGRRWEREKRMDGAREKPTRAELRALEDEIERMKQELQADADDEANGRSKKQTLGDFAPRWLEHSATTGKARKHVVGKRLHELELFVLPTLGNCELLGLKRSDLTRWMEKVATMRQPNGMLYGKNTLLGAWATLRSLVKRAVLMNDLPHDPSVGLRFEIGDHVSGEERPNRGPKAALTLDELRALLDATKHESPDIRAMIIVQVSTGMRFCEVSALEWRDTDLAAGKLRISRSQVGGVVGAPKTESTRRDVFLSPAVVDVLRTHRAWQATNGAKKKDGVKVDLVFPSRDGGYRATAVLKKPLERCRKIAGIDKHLTSHCLRKTANDLLRRASGDTVARAMIGHTTSEMTRLYSNVDHDEKARAHAAAFKDVLDAGVPRNSVGDGTLPTRSVGEWGKFRGGTMHSPTKNANLTSSRKKKTPGLPGVSW